MQMYTALQVNYSERRDNGTVEEGELGGAERDVHEASFLSPLRCKSLHQASAINLASFGNEDRFRIFYDILQRGREKEISDG